MKIPLYWHFKPLLHNHALHIQQNCACVSIQEAITKNKKTLKFNFIHILKALMEEYRKYWKINFIASYRLANNT